MARILSVAEITGTYGEAAVWVETREMAATAALVTGESRECVKLVTVHGEKKWRKDLLGQTWRCWSGKPSPWQQEEAEWQDGPG